MTNGQAVLEPLLDQTDGLITQILVALPLRALRWRTALTLLGFFGLVLIDASLNWNTVGSSFAMNELGLETGNTLVAVAFSLLSVFAWLLVGCVWAAGYHQAARAAFGLVVLVVGFVSAPIVSPFVLERWMSVGFPAPSPLLMLIGMGLFTLLLSIPGVLLCIEEQQLARLWKDWRIRESVIALQEKLAAARAILATRDAVEGNLREHKAQRERIVSEVVLQVEREIEAGREEQGKAAEAALADVTLSKGERHNAWKRLQRHRDDNDKSRMAGGMKLVLFFLLLTGSPAWAASPVEALLEKAPTLLIVLDNTLGSPALEPAYLPHIERFAQERLDRLQIGSSVVVFTVGDPRLPHEVKRWRVQTRITERGGTVGYLKQALHVYLQDFVGRQHPEKAKGSHLVLGWFDAANLLNDKADSENFVLFVTDAMEASPLGNCYRDCKLPTPTFSLKNTNFSMLGIGHGQSSEKTLAVFAAWEKFFKAAGIPKTHLLHVF